MKTALTLKNLFTFLFAAVAMMGLLLLLALLQISRKQSDLAAVNQQLYNVQAAGVRGSLSLQGEWFGNVIQQPGAGPVFLHGSMSKRAGSRRANTAVTTAYAAPSIASASASPSFATTGRDPASARSS